ncbi:hypothetical protein AB0L53_01175 [Nonomuraea sp. NPDC052129]|uniref:hypothetical protein n=1 Tax=Nonomuraea sp. NPDC052129 TaxID=3154651 RepID=UPI00343D3458
MALLTFTATIVFGLTWMTYRRTYGAFGLTPDEVGLDYGTVLSRAATGFGVLAVFAVLSWGAWRLFNRLSAEVETPAVGIRDALVGSIAAEFLILTYFLLSGGILPEAFFWHFAIATLAQLACLVAVAAHRVGNFSYQRRLLFTEKTIGKITGMARTPAIGKITRIMRAPAVLVALIVLLYTPNAAGANLADALKLGGTIPSRLFPSLVDAKVVAVDLSWVPETQHETLSPFYDPDFYYLGQREGLVILYETRSHRVLRVSSQNIVMQSFSFK